MIKIAVIIEDLDEEASGPSNSVPLGACAVKNSKSFFGSICIFTRRCHKNNFKSIDVPKIIEVYPKKLKSKYWLISLVYWLKNIRKIWDEFEVVHLHGTWTPSFFAVSLIPKKKNKKFIFSPRGSLSPWSISNNNWKKRLAWPFLKLLILKVDILMATSELERSELRKIFPYKLIKVIPNCLNIREISFDKPKAINNPKKFLFLSRIHPKKGLSNLLDAWVDFILFLKKEENDLIKLPSLIIAGKGDEIIIKKIIFLEEKNLFNIFFIGPIYSEEKYKIYRESDFFILPSQSENFGMVIGESLSTDTPVIVTKETSWENIEEVGVGFLTKKSKESIFKSLIRSNSIKDEDYLMMCKRSSKYIKSNFSETIIGERLVEIYNQVVN